MVVDDLRINFARTPHVRRATRQFIEQEVGANDLMAVAHTAGSLDTARSSPATSGSFSPLSTRRTA